jgi:four helix bundle protein
MRNQNRTQKIPKDLQIRTTRLAKEIMSFLKLQKMSIYNEHSIKQLLRSSSSIGPNYTEARECTSKKDFLHKIAISKKEAKETMYWLDLLEGPKTTSYVQESHELVLIFASMCR